MTDEMEGRIAQRAQDPFIKEYTENHDINKPPIVYGIFLN